MSILRSDSIRDREGTGAPNFPNGATVTGVITATSFSGNLTGNVTGNINSSGVSTLTTLNGTSGLVSLGSTIKTKGFVETQTSATTSSNILDLDAANGTVFTHTTTDQIGIVSFKGIRTEAAGTRPDRHGSSAHQSRS